MAATAEETLADEERRRPVAAAAAFAAGLATLLGGILAALAYRDFPDVQLVGALREGLRSGASPEPGLKARQVLFYDDNAVTLIAIAVLLALAAGAIGYALTHLYRSTKARRPELPRGAVVAAVAGAVGVAVSGLVQAVGVSVDASSFAGSEQQTAQAARDVLESPVAIAAALVRQIGVFGLGFAFILLSLNAMRVGLLTRFMGVLGIIVGVLFVVPLGSSLPIVQAFWLLALGALFLGRWPSGPPPAWATGVAQPWPTQQEIRESRTEARAERAEAKGAAAPSQTPAPEAPARPAHPASRKRKRKRR
jgi:hypothetical protein